MDGFVKNFIAMSIIYLTAASLMGVGMLLSPELIGTLKFSHSHLMLIGWVTMMIYGVGYHILPRFAGKLLDNPLLCQVHFWMANVGLIGMVVVQPLYLSNLDNKGYMAILAIAGTLQILSSLIFFYNMIKTIYHKVEPLKPAA
jgi:cbb3-type cytochrome oxidase subunit 1